MAFQRVGLSKATDFRLREQLANAAMHEPERSMSNRRLAGSFLSLCLGIGVLYASIFYAPAFFDVNRALGYSTENLKLPAYNPDEKKSRLASYTNAFKIRRGFIRQGQALKIDYKLTPGTSMTLHIKRCNAPVFVEVFTCMDVEGQQVQIKNSTSGARSFIMRQPGFYYFDEVVTNADGSPTDKPYSVLWSRKKISPAKTARLTQ